eukprot:1147516-Amphidinium_carterae.1
MVHCNSLRIGLLRLEELKNLSLQNLRGRGRRAGSTMRAAWLGFLVAELTRTMSSSSSSSSSTSEQFLLSLRDWPLADVAAWNALALFQRETGTAKTKLQLVQRLARSFPMLGILEAHIWSHDHAVQELGLKEHQIFTSVVSSTCGGVLVAIRRDIVASCSVTWKVLVPGCGASIVLERAGLVREYVFAHITPEHHRSWLSVVDLLAHAYKDCHHLVVLIGDVNMVSDGMRVDPHGTPHFDSGPRLAQWNSRFDMFE